MMSPDERKVALQKMQETNDWFYCQAIQIGNHPYIEFCGLLNEYTKACREAHEAGIDFTECNRHSGQILPVQPHSSDYISEKLECIFSGAKALTISEQEVKAGSYFPILIKCNEVEEVVHEPSDLPIGKPFVVLHTNLSSIFGEQRQRI